MAKTRRSRARPCSFHGRTCPRCAWAWHAASGTHPSTYHLRACHHSWFRSGLWAGSFFGRHGGRPLRIVPKVACTQPRPTRGRLPHIGSPVRSRVARHPAGSARSTDTTVHGWGDQGEGGRVRTEASLRSCDVPGSADILRYRVGRTRPNNGRSSGWARCRNGAS
jgi:hypothetical protein